MPTRTDRLLSRLARALAVCGRCVWATGPSPATGDWPEDLPALPDDLERLLRRHDAGERYYALLLPTLSVSPWQEFAEKLRAEPIPGRFPLSPYLALEPGGQLTRFGWPVADSLADLIELEALVHELLPNSRVRRLRVNGPLDDWRPCDALSEEELEECEVGTLLFAKAQPMGAYALKVAPGWWISDRRFDKPEEPDLVWRIRDQVHAGALSPAPPLAGERWWRSSLSVWWRPPLQQLLERQPRSPVPYRTAGGPPALQALWEHFGVQEGFDRPTCDLLAGLGLLPLMFDGDLSEALCVDARGRYALPGAVIRWRRDADTCTVVHESIEDWLETLLLKDEAAEITSHACPRYLALDWFDRAGLLPESAGPPSVLEQVVATAQGEARPLLDLAADALVGLDWGEEPQGPPELAVLGDFLHDHGLPVGRATLATLTTRLAPLLEPVP